MISVGRSPRRNLEMKKARVHPEVIIEGILLLQRASSLCHAHLEGEVIREAESTRIVHQDQGDRRAILNGGAQNTATDNN